MQACLCRFSLLVALLAMLFCALPDLALCRVCGGSAPDTPSSSSLPSPSVRPSRSQSPSPSSTRSVTPSPSLNASLTSSPSESISPEPSSSPSLSLSFSPSPSPSPEESVSESLSAPPSTSTSSSPSESPSQTKLPSSTLSHSPTASPSLNTTCYTDLHCYNAFFDLPLRIIDNHTYKSDSLDYAQASSAIYSIVYEGFFPGVLDPRKVPDVTSYVNLWVLNETTPDILITDENPDGVYSAFCFDLFHNSSQDHPYNASLLSVLDPRFNASLQDYYNCTGTKTHDIYSGYIDEILYLVNVQPQQDIDGADLQCAIWTLMFSGPDIDVDTVPIQNDDQLDCNDGYVRMLMNESIAFVADVPDPRQLVCEYGTGIMLAVLLPELCGPQILAIETQLDQLDLCPDVSSETDASAAWRSLRRERWLF